MRNDPVPKLALVECAPSDLVVPARNVRKVKPAHLREVAGSISSLGFCDPVLIDERNTVLDGVVRVEAAKLLGLPHVFCIRADHLTAAEHRLVRIALNRLSEKGSWNLDTLKLELKELILEDAPIEITGFSMPKVDHIIIGEKPAAVEAGPLAPDPGAKPIVQGGDIFILGEHQIICGDSTDPGVLEVLMFGEDDKARLILTDEPYNGSVAGHETSGERREFLLGSGEANDAEFRAFNLAWIGACLPYVCDGGLCATFTDWRGYPAVVAAALQLGLAPFDLIVWAKTDGAMGNLYRSQHELLPLFKKGKAPHIHNVKRGKKGRSRSNVWTYPRARLGSEARQGRQDHPTVKPVALLEDALLDMSERGDIVIDPFLGSGSTLIACEKTGRHCRGLELDPLYVEVILRRYEAVTGQAAVLESTGEIYAELAVRREAERRAYSTADSD
jgi:DNA modification methylase